ncbi:MAG: hypothetical protein H7323_15850 [Frankiales bacterium]|nr:hypothetical protein [Frankiales bacterium]
MTTASTAPGPVRLSSLSRHPALLLIPLLLMLAMRSARVVCRLVQGAIPLTGVLLPLPLEDAVALQGHVVR